MLTIQRFALNQNALAGLVISDEASIDAQDGEIRANTIGLNIQAPNFDLTKSFKNVLLIDNEVDQDFSELFIPEIKPIQFVDIFEP